MSKVVLGSICKYRTVSVDVDPSAYVSTDSMLPNKAGISKASSIPVNGKARVYHKGDTLVSNIRPYFKKIWQASGDGCCSPDVLVFEPTGCNADYLYWLLSSDSFFDYVVATSKGTKMPRGDKTAIMHYEFEAVDEGSQGGIAEVLNPIRELILANKRTNDYLTAIASCIWRQYARRSPARMAIGQAAKEVITGKTPPTKRTELYGYDYPFITIPDMHDNVWLISSERCLSEAGNKTQQKKLVNRGTVLVSCIATLGLVGIVSKPSHFNQQINAVVPKRAGEEYFLYHALRSIKQKLLGVGAAGSVKRIINKGIFSEIEIPWLHIDEMDEYIYAVKPLFEAIEANSEECLRLSSLRDALLPKLMSGEIDVSQIEVPTQPNNHLRAD